MRTRDETILLVHGSFTTVQMTERTQWFERSSDFSKAIDAAAEANGSSARCWAHCEQGEEGTNIIFSWSGENTWIARSNAAERLAEYIGRLLVDGWKVHVIAHSHGGTVLLAALRLLTQIRNPDHYAFGNLVCMGSPFIDVHHLISEHHFLKSARKIHFISGPLVFLTLFVFALSGFGHGIVSSPAWPLFLIMGPLLLMALFLIASYRKLSDWRSHTMGTAGPRLLVLNSDQDEVWQLLGGLLRLSDPFRSGDANAPSNWLARGRRFFREAEALAYPVSSQATAIGLMSAMLFIASSITLKFNGQQTASDVLAVGAMIVVAVIYLSTARKQHAAIAFNSLISLPLKPFRAVRALIAVALTEFISRFVKKHAWEVIRSQLLGTDGLPTAIIAAERTPHSPAYKEPFFRYENLSPEIASELATRRNVDVGTEWARVTEYLANPGTISFDAMRVLRTVSTGINAVHTSYYSDQRTVKRIGDWICRSEAVVRQEWLVWFNQHYPSVPEGARQLFLDPLLDQGGNPIHVYMVPSGIEAGRFVFKECVHNQ